MNYNGSSVISGIVIMFFVSFILIAIITFIWASFAKNAHEIKLSKMLWNIAVSTLAWSVITYTVVALLSSYGKLIFGALSAFSLFLAFYFVFSRFLEFKTRDRIVYSMLIAIIVNPIWLSVLGII